MVKFRRQHRVVSEYDDTVRTEQSDETRKRFCRVARVHGHEYDGVRFWVGCLVGMTVEEVGASFALILFMNTLPQV